MRSDLYFNTSCMYIHTYVQSQAQLTKDLSHMYIYNTDVNFSNHKTYLHTLTCEMYFRAA